MALLGCKCRAFSYPANSSSVEVWRWFALYWESPSACIAGVVELLYHFLRNSFAPLAVNKRRSRSRLVENLSVMTGITGSSYLRLTSRTRD
jgi:hypothetical protein